MTREEELREINEAIQAGQSALNAICEAERHLGNARGLGIWDMLGGGLISGLIKHSQIDEAQECVNRAQAALQRFQKELQDVDMNFNYGVRFDGVTKAIDLIFDNFLVDALIQFRIRETQENLKQSRYQVEQALNQLQQMKEQICVDTESRLPGQWS